MGKQLRKAVFGICLLLIPGMAWAQTATISGSVVDEDGEPLIGANVLIEELVIGASTDLSGRYTFEVPSAQVKGQVVTLRAGYIGFSPETREITLEAGEQRQDFTLLPDLLNLDEVVVTGVTEATPAKKLAFTVDKLDTQALELAPSSSPVGSMQGKVAGVQIVQNSGQPGEPYSVRLRGSTSISGSSQPLFIVDGVILGADQVDIGSLDVENIEIVKGAAASSLYGSRAQNGVVQITTKRGTAVPLNQTRVTIRNEFGMSSLQEDLVAARSHNFAVNGSGQFLDSDGNIVAYGPEATIDTEFNGVSFIDNPYTGQTFNAFDQFFDPGNTSTNYISISQNSSKTNFHASFENFQEDGVIQGTDGFNRKSFRINLDHRLYNNLSVSGMASYSQSTSDRIANLDFNPLFGIMFTSPLSNLEARDENGDLLIQPDPLSVEENPLYIIENGDINNRRARVLSNFRARYSPFNWMDLEGSISYDRSDRERREFYNRGFQSIDPSSINDGRLVRSTTVSEALNADLTVSLRRQFGPMTGRTQLKYQVEDFNDFNEFLTGDGLTSGGIPDFSNVNGEKDVSSNKRVIRAEGYYLTAGLDYEDKYIADFLVRRDGSSLFGEDERWQTYFRVSGAYRVSEEAWWPFASFMDEFKLRYSFGTAGARPNFEAQYETFSLSDGLLQKNTLGNAKLKPELQTEMEYGVEAVLFNKFSTSLVYADSRVEDQLLAVPLAGLFGFSTQWRNAGTIESNTIEFEISAPVISSRDMSLDLGFVFDRTRQEITEFNTNAFRGGPRNVFYYRDDEIIGAMYGNRWAESVSDLPADLQSFGNHFDVNDDGYLVAVGENNTFEDGIAKELWGTSVDVNGTSYDWGIPFKFEEEDGNNFVEIGNSIPDFNLGFSTNFTYKGFTAYALLNAQVGGDVYNFTKQWSYRDNRASDQDQAGKADGLKKTTRYYEVLYDATASNSHFVEDATYIKLRELSLGYTFNRAQLQKYFGNTLNKVSINVIGRNLLTITDYTGFDPEVGDGGDATLFRIDNFEYPSFRSVTGRLEIQF